MGEGTSISEKFIKFIGLGPKLDSVQPQHNSEELRQSYLDKADKLQQEYPTDMPDHVVEEVNFYEQAARELPPSSK